MFKSWKHIINTKFIWLIYFNSSRIPGRQTLPRSRWQRLIPWWRARVAWTIWTRLRQWQMNVLGLSRERPQTELKLRPSDWISTVPRATDILGTTMVWAADGKSISKPTASMCTTCLRSIRCPHHLFPTKPLPLTLPCHACTGLRDNPGALSNGTATGRVWGESVRLPLRTWS